MPALAAAEQDTEGDPGLRPPSGLTVTVAAIKGDPTTREYYLPGCPQYDYLNTATVVIFPSEEAAQRAGYHKAENCS